MYYIAVYDENENQIGWINSVAELTTTKSERAGFSSKETADQLRYSLEEKNPDWYTELEEK